MIASEALPYSKTGGLADVMSALPSSLARLGCRVTVVTPRYRGVEAGTRVEHLPVSIGAHRFDVGFFEESLPEGVQVLLLEVPELFDREALYHVGHVDYPDNARRFALLAKAALEWVAHRGTPIDIVHAHDWQGGLAAVYLRTLYASHPVLGGTASVFTIHNLAYQGLFEPDWLPRLDLPWDLFAIDRLEYWGRISFLKGGINDSTMITTVSRTYAKESQTREFGCGFEGVLQRRAADLVGILNGIDVDVWDPRRDRHLPVPFDADDLSGKRASKAAVLARVGLPTDEATIGRPLIGMVSRMVDQKGLDLIAANAWGLPGLDASFAVLGTGDHRYQDMWRELAQQHPDRIGVHIGFDEGLAHLIEGGSDMFLMPSRFEPCGLNQMYSLRYGTVPIVRAIGGLADTVVDWTPRRRNATGIVFRDYTPAALLDALKRALALYQRPDTWRALQVAGMQRDHSWDHSAREYVQVYDQVLRQARPRRGAASSS